MDLKEYLETISDFPALYQRLRIYIINKEMSLVPPPDTFLEAIIYNENFVDLYKFQGDLGNEHAYWWKFYQSIVNEQKEKGFPVYFQKFQKYLQLFKGFFLGYLENESD